MERVIREILEKSKRDTSKTINLLKFVLGIRKTVILIFNNYPCRQKLISPLFLIFYEVLTRISGRAISRVSITDWVQVEGARGQF